MSISVLPRFVNNIPACIILHRQECTGCSRFMNNNFFGIVSVYSNVGSPPTYHEDSDDYIDTDSYYPFFHLVCQSCYERLANNTPGTLEFFRENKPEWSALDTVFDSEDGSKRMCEVTDEKEIRQLFSEISHSSIWYDHLSNLEWAKTESGKELHMIEKAAMEEYPEY